MNENANSVGGIFAQQETLAYESNFLDLDPNVIEATSWRAAEHIAANFHKPAVYAGYIPIPRTTRALPPNGGRALVRQCGRRHGAIRGK